MQTPNSLLGYSTTLYLRWACTKYKPSKKFILNTRAVLLIAAILLAETIISTATLKSMSYPAILSTPPQRKVHDNIPNEN